MHILWLRNTMSWLANDMHNLTPSLNSGGSFCHLGKSRQLFEFLLSSRCCVQHLTFIISLNLLHFVISPFDREGNWGKEGKWIVSIDVAKNGGESLLWFICLMTWKVLPGSDSSSSSRGLCGHPFYLISSNNWSLTITVCITTKKNWGRGELVFHSQLNDIFLKGKNSVLCYFVILWALG